MLGEYKTEYERVPFLPSELLTLAKFITLESGIATLPPHGGETASSEQGSVESSDGANEHDIVNCVLKILDGVASGSFAEVNEKIAELRYSARNLAHSDSVQCQQMLNDEIIAKTICPRALTCLAMLKSLLPLQTNASGSSSVSMHAGASSATASNASGSTLLNKFTKTLDSSLNAVMDEYDAVGRRTPYLTIALSHAMTRVDACFGSSQEESRYWWHTHGGTYFPLSIARRMLDRVELGLIEPQEQSAERGEERRQQYSTTTDLHNFVQMHFETMQRMLKDARNRPLAELASEKESQRELTATVDDLRKERDDLYQKCGYRTTVPIDDHSYRDDIATSEAQSTTPAVPLRSEEDAENDIDCYESCLSSTLYTRPERWGPRRRAVCSGSSPGTLAMDEADAALRFLLTATTSGTAHDATMALACLCAVASSDLHAQHCGGWSTSKKGQRAEVIPNDGGQGNSRDGNACSAVVVPPASPSPLPCDEHGNHDDISKERDPKSAETATYRSHRTCTIEDFATSQQQYTGHYCSCCPSGRAECQTCCNSRSASWITVAAQAAFTVWKRFSGKTAMKNANNATTAANECDINKGYNACDACALAAITLATTLVRRTMLGGMSAAFGLRSVASCAQERFGTTTSAQGGDRGARIGSWDDSYTFYRIFGHGSDDGCMRISDGTWQSFILYETKRLVSTIQSDLVASASHNTNAQNVANAATASSMSNVEQLREALFLWMLFASVDASVDAAMLSIAERTSDAWSSSHETLHTLASSNSHTGSTDAPRVSAASLLAVRFSVREWREPLRRGLACGCYSGTKMQPVAPPKSDRGAAASAGASYMTEMVDGCEEYVCAAASPVAASLAAATRISAYWGRFGRTDTWKRLARNNRLQGLPDSVAANATDIPDIYARNAYRAACKLFNVDADAAETFDSACDVRDFKSHTRVDAQQSETRANAQIQLRSATAREERAIGACVAMSWAAQDLCKDALCATVTYLTHVLLSSAACRALTMYKEHVRHTPYEGYRFAPHSIFPYIANRAVLASSCASGAALHDSRIIPLVIASCSWNAMFNALQYNTCNATVHDRQPNALPEAAKSSEDVQRIHFDVPFELYSTVLALALNILDGSNMCETRENAWLLGAINGLSAPATAFVLCDGCSVFTKQTKARESNNIFDFAALGHEPFDVDALESISTLLANQPVIDDEHAILQVVSAMAIKNILHAKEMSWNELLRYCIFHYTHQADEARTTTSFLVQGSKYLEHYLSCQYILSTGDATRHLASLWPSEQLHPSNAVDNAATIIASQESAAITPKDAQVEQCADTRDTATSDESDSECDEFDEFDKRVQDVIDSNIGQQPIDSENTIPKEHVAAKDRFMSGMRSIFHGVVAAVVGDVAPTASVVAEDADARTTEEEEKAGDKIEDGHELMDNVEETLETIDASVALDQDGKNVTVKQTDGGTIVRIAASSDEQQRDTDDIDKASEDQSVDGTDTAIAAKLHVVQCEPSDDATPTRVSNTHRMLDLACDTSERCNAAWAWQSNAFESIKNDDELLLALCIAYTTVKDAQGANNVYEAITTAIKNRRTSNGESVLVLATFANATDGCIALLYRIVEACSCAVSWFQDSMPDAYVEVLLSETTTNPRLLKVLIPSMCDCATDLLVSIDEYESQIFERNVDTDATLEAIVRGNGVDRLFKFAIISAQLFCGSALNVDLVLSASSYIELLESARMQSDLIYLARMQCEAIKARVQFEYQSVQSDQNSTQVVDKARRTVELRQIIEPLFGVFESIGCAAHLRSQDDVNVKMIGTLMINGTRIFSRERRARLLLPERSNGAECQMDFVDYANAITCDIIQAYLVACKTFTEVLPLVSNKLSWNLQERADESVEYLNMGYRGTAFAITLYEVLALFCKANQVAVEQSTGITFSHVSVIILALFKALAQAFVSRDEADVRGDGSTALLSAFQSEFVRRREKWKFPPYSDILETWCLQLADCCIAELK